jgi:hypothetical protein
MNLLSTIPQLYHLFCIIIKNNCKTGTFYLRPDDLPDEDEDVDDDPDDPDDFEPPADEELLTPEPEDTDLEDEDRTEGVLNDLD